MGGNTETPEAAAKEGKRRCRAGGERAAREAEPSEQ